MSADSLLRYLADQTTQYRQMADTANAKRAADQQARGQAVQDERNRLVAEAQKPTVFQQMAQEGGNYSEAKLQEQRQPGQLAASGNDYADRRLREQLGMPSPEAKPAHPLENYLGAVQSQDDYRPAMMQYLASGGKRPQWFTGNYDVDKPNIDAAISSTMTPAQQQDRQLARTKSADLEEARQARIQLAKDVEARRAQDAAQKREGIKAKAAIPTRDDRQQALNVLGGVLGEKFSGLSTQAQDAAATKAASIAKAKVGTPEAQGVDFESLLSDAYNEMISKGELRMPEKGSFFGIEMPFGGHGAEFKPGGMAAVPQSAAPKAAVPKPGEVQQGYRFKGGNPADPKSWEKV